MVERSYHDLRFLLWIQAQRLTSGGCHGGSEKCSCGPLWPMLFRCCGALSSGRLSVVPAPKPEPSLWWSLHSFQTRTSRTRKIKVKDSSFISNVHELEELEAALYLPFYLDFRLNENNGEKKKDELRVEDICEWCCVPSLTHTRNLWVAPLTLL